VPEATRAERRAAGRDADRRRQAADELRLAASLAEYAAGQIGNGLTPGQARRAAVEAAGELEAAAAAVRRLARLRLAERRAVAKLLAAQGMSRVEIARRLGVSDRAVYYYVRGRPSL
jgi:DNA-binding CsgD family transcriptional regulator